MKLEIGKRYATMIDERGGFRAATIGGYTKNGPAGSVYSMQGDWYDADTGRIISYEPSTGGRHTRPNDWRNLVREMPE